MAGRPSIQFYFGDWKKNKKLRFCSWAARGTWIEVMGLMHDSEESVEYGVLRKPLKAIAQAIGAPTKLLQELATNGVMRGCATGVCEPLIYQPKSGRVLGEPVTLIEAQQGPIWYSARMVVDEYVRLKRGDTSRFGDGFGGSLKGGFGDGLGDAPNAPPNAPEGDGASASASSSSSELLSLNAGEGTSGLLVTDGEGRPAPPPDNAQALGVGVPAAKRLRAIGIRVTALDPTLLALCTEKFTVEDMALMAAEQVLRKVHLFGDSDVHPELPELLASAATQQQMLLTAAQYADIQAAAAEISIAYIAKALRGRRQDAIDKQSPNRPPPKHGARKPSAADNFKGKTYVGTPVDQLPAELRAGFERSLDGGPG